MKKFITLLPLSLFAVLGLPCFGQGIFIGTGGPAIGAPTYVNETFGTYNGGTCTSNSSCSAASQSVTIGNGLSVKYFSSSSVGTVTVTDTCGASGSDTYTVDASNASGYDKVYVFHTIAGKTGTCTVSVTSTGGQPYALAWKQISNVNQTTPVVAGQTAANAQISPGTSANAITSGSITTTATNDLIDADCNDAEVGRNTMAVGTGFTINSSTALLSGVLGETATAASAGAISGTCTDSTNGGGDVYLTGALAWQHP